MVIDKNLNKKFRLKNFVHNVHIQLEADSTAEKRKYPAVESLHELGYHQELHRNVSSFASFAAGFSFVSIITTVFQLFPLGFSFGGAAFIWTWPIVFGGQLLVALSFATLAARWPVSGAIYQWSSRLAGVMIGWFAGWIMIIAQILTMAAAAIAIQAVLPQIWSGFQIWGGSSANTSITSATGAANSIILGVILLGLCTFINCLGVRIVSWMNRIGVLCELVAVLVIIVMFFLHRHQSFDIIFSSKGAESPSGKHNFSHWLISGLMASYVIVGFDSAGELSEETYSPRYTTPRTIVRSVVLSGILGGILIIETILAVSNIYEPNFAQHGLVSALRQIMGDYGSKCIFMIAAVAVLTCTCTIQTSGTRMMFSMARESALPGGRFLSTVSHRSGIPLIPTVIFGLCGGIVLILNLAQPAVFSALTSICIAMIYIAYLGVTLPLLWKNISPSRKLFVTLGTDEYGRPWFNLGKFSLIVTLLAVIFQLCALTNLIWPRSEVYDPIGKTWWLRWSALIFIALIFLAGGFIYYFLKISHLNNPLNHAISQEVL